ncbi:unnamed protein product [Calypogeia fissa]
METSLELPLQRETFEKDMVDLYRDGAHVMKARRDGERNKQQKLTQKYSKEQADNHSKSGKARIVELSCLAAKTEEMDVIVLDDGIDQPSKRVRKAKEIYSLVLSKVLSTRSRSIPISQAEFGTTDSSPNNLGNLAMKDLDKVIMPSCLVSQGKGISEGKNSGRGSNTPSSGDKTSKRGGRGGKAVHGRGRRLYNEHGR